MDIDTRFRQDHLAIVQGFERLEKSSHGSKRERYDLFDDLASLIRAHIWREQAELYAYLRAHSTTGDFVENLRVDCRVMADLLDRLEAMSNLDENWEPTFMALRVIALHHIQEEEAVLLERLPALAVRQAA
ncbi:MAG: hemerythrin domain-containing protein [Bacteriovoracia bacterium]